MKNTKQFNLLCGKDLGYEAPSIRMMEVCHEGMLCTSEERQIDDFDLLEETDW